MNTLTKIATGPFEIVLRLWQHYARVFREENIYEVIDRTHVGRALRFVFVWITLFAFMVLVLVLGIGLFAHMVRFIFH